MKTFLHSVLCVLALAFVAACDNPVDPNGDDHAETEGYVLLLDGQEAARLQDGEITGQVTVRPGETTGDIAIEFLDHDGDRIDPFELDDDFAMVWEIIDESIASFEETGPWSIELTGERQGSTHLIPTLMHLTHHELSTPPPGIPVVVQ